VVTDVGNREFVPQVAGPMLEDELHLAAMEVVVEVRGDGELGAVGFALALESWKSEAQVGHDPEGLL
jgi:hypothetical protein